MPVSFGYDNRIECLECKTFFTTKTWIIIDRQEHPDLWERCRIDTIHCYQCPPGHAHRIQEPLLLHDPFMNRLLFSPSKISSQEQAAEDFQYLIAQALPTLPHATRDCLEERLRIVNRDVLPLAMANLAPEVIASVKEIYQMLSGPFDPGEAAQRIELSKYALSMFTREQAPMLWGTFVSRLATYIGRDPRGDRSSHIEEALQLRQLVLSTLLEHHEPIRVAIELMNLGNLYAERTHGSPSENRDQAIALIRQSLEVFLPSLFPDFCALAYYNLGNQFLRTGVGYLAEDTEQAIAAFEEGAKAITSKSNPKKWGDIHHNLGIAYHRRIQGNLSENQEHAIAAYEQALKVRTVNAAPHDRVLTQMDLGNALLERTAGERAENIELAIEAYSSAAALSIQNGYKIDWARLQYDLSNAYLVRIHGLREENIQKSIKAGCSALTVLTREHFPDDWGNIQQNLGNAYREYARAGHPEEIERAIEAYSAALSVRSPEWPEHRERSVADWVMTMDSLAGAYAERVTGDPAANQEKSIQLMEEAARMDLRELAPRTYVRFLVNLGSAYRDRQSGVVEQNREKAVKVFKTAIEFATQQHCYEELSRAVLRLSLLRGQKGEWEQAYQELTSASRVLDQAYASSITNIGKEAQAESNWYLYQMLSEACLHISRPREALAHAEEGRSRVLRDELAMLPIPLPASAPRALLNKEQELLDKVRELDLAIRNTGNIEQRKVFVQEAEQARMQLENIWSQIAQNPDGIEYVSLRRGEGFSWEQLQNWLQSQNQPTALVEYVDLHERLVAFVVRAGVDQPQIVNLPILPAELLELCSTYTEGLRDLKAVPPGTMSQVSRELGHRLIDPLWPYLNEVKAVCLVPDGLLHFIPLHALEHEGPSLLEAMSVRYVPSATVAMRSSRSQTIGPTAGEAFIAGNPSGDLPFAEVEATAIARQLGTEAIVGKTLSMQYVMKELQRTTVAHIAAHAYFDANDPFSSGIILADGKILQARDAMKKQLHLNLLVLSACSTGMQMANAGNSLTGFARAFFYAGVRSLVLTLWPVNDLSTMLLMNEFYLGLNQGLAVEDALRRAQLWLRNATAGEISSWFRQEKARSNEARIVSYERASSIWRSFVALDPEERPFRHPHYWAPFFMTEGR